ncbi:hypothetical protein ACDS01_002713 [Salmonella enterica]|nr:hypothetical protein SeSPB_A2531 [Salmonella enterica subsp. enterica serovar Saintpaul str. SARA29]EEA7619306.1 hypothetical protein [Salmonella enterica]EEH6329002.1 hypothetical protein [Salmonella enterica]EEI7277163.1 hypothetical protein [Salmonella enterica]EFR1775650.1 hypothetical protein [Salmonella enterica]
MSLIFTPAQAISLVSPNPASAHTLAVSGLTSPMTPVLQEQIFNEF